jgi:hypothetical protein
MYSSSKQVDSPSDLPVDDIGRRLFGVASCGSGNGVARGGGVGSSMLAAASIFFLSLLSYSRGLCLNYQWCFSRLRTMSLICSWGWLGCWLVVWRVVGA